MLLQEMSPGSGLGDFRPVLSDVLTVIEGCGEGLLIVGIVSMLIVLLWTETGGYDNVGGVLAMLSVIRL